MPDNLKSTIDWMKSAKGITILCSVLLATYATITSGPYILVNTIITGGMLALVATGLTLMLGVLNIAMFAHGEYFMIGSLSAYYVFTPISEYITMHPDSFLVVWGPLIAILASMVVGAIAGVISELLVFGPLRKRATDNWVMNSFLLTVGLSVLLVNLHQLIFGADFKGIVRYWGGMPFSFADVFISRDRVYAFCISALIVALFYLFMTYTRTGRGHPGRIPGRHRRPDRGHQHRDHRADDHLLELRPGRSGRRQPALHVPLLPHHGPGTPLHGLVRGHPVGSGQYIGGRGRRLHGGPVKGHHRGICGSRMGFCGPLHPHHAHSHL